MWLSLDVLGCLDLLLGLVASAVWHCGGRGAMLLGFSILKEGAGQCCWKSLHAVQQESTVWQVSSRWRGEACVPASGLFLVPSG